jgi:hypothetical protein
MEISRIHFEVEVGLVARIGLADNAGLDIGLVMPFEGEISPLADEDKARGWGRAGCLAAGSDLCLVCAAG